MLSEYRIPLILSIVVGRAGNNIGLWQRFHSLHPSDLLCALETIHLWHIYIHENQLIVKAMLFLL